jgi:hypothetical protein
MFSSDIHSSAGKVPLRLTLKGYQDADLEPLLAGMGGRLRRYGQCVAVLDGDCAAGKTTLAGKLAPLYQANVIRMDDFFLPPDLRTSERMGEPGGNIHYERFEAEVLKEIGYGKPFEYTRYDCHTGYRDACRVMPCPVTFIEGSYSQHPRFAPHYERIHALKIWVKVEGGEQLRRLKGRSPALLSRFEREWIPLEKAYAAVMGCEEKADYVLESLPW